ncbi:uncharacterized protein LOC113353346 [Papaver somniferum]|uniref:uncharacterized protein LOC113353346 n=1 Tax=Papaver somniferum TaxID=3469 RepID=UPI000E6F7BB3|nr:uncharacterized protein LOC113353346 [Papaver somniferum]
MAKSLRAKYYPDGNLFELQKKSNTTWSWRSISSEIQFIKQHNCWNLGNGDSILIWNHCWIPELQSLPLPKLGCSSAQDYTYVKQMFLPGCAEWNSSLLDQLFNPVLVQHILQITIHPSRADRLVWLLEKNGRFNVKSCYKKMYQKSSSIPPVDIRMGKISVDYGNFQVCLKSASSSGKPSPIFYPPKTFWILVVWFAVLGWTSDNNGSLSEWILSWIIIPSQLTPRINGQNVFWIPPPMGFLTFNCDGSFDANTQLGGIGLILRNFAGMQQAARCISMNGARSAEQVECMGFWNAVQWAKDLNLERVHFEMDAKLVVDAVNTDNSAIDWRLLNTVLDIKSFFLSFSSWKLSYVPKERNKVADLLANPARKDRISFIWNNSPLPGIVDQVVVECSHVLG